MGQGLSRRDLLVAGTGIALGSLGSRAFTQIKAEQPHDSQELNWTDIRAQFDLDPTKVHMAGLLLASHPKPVRDAIERYRRELDRNPVDYYHGQEVEGEKRVRVAAAAYLNAQAANIALTDSTTQALGVLYNGIKVRPDQETLTTVHDHASTFVTLGLRNQRMGTKLRSVKLYDPGQPVSGEQMADTLAKAIRPETRVIAVTWVHSSTGMRLPIHLFSEAVKKANQGRAEDDRVLLCVDGVHGFGVENIDIRQMGCDFFAAGCHKWIFGPRGTGLLYGNPEVSKFVTPCTISFSGFENWGQGLTPGGFHSFEHRWALPEAFAFHQKIGKARVRSRIHDLARQCKEGLAKMPNITLYTPMSDDLSAALVCFNVKSIGQNQVVSRLAAKNIIASTTPYMVSYARLTPGLLNTPEEVDRVLAEIRAMV